MGWHYQGGVVGWTIESFLTIIMADGCPGECCMFAPCQMDLASSAVKDWIIYSTAPWTSFSGARWAGG